MVESSIKRAALIGVFTFVFYIAQFAVHNVFGSLFRPDFLLLLTLFFTLYRGIRYGLVCAFFSGLFSDSLQTGPFGLYLLTYVLCVYLAVLVKIYIYQGETGLGGFIAFIMSVVKVGIMYGIICFFIPVNFYETVMNIMVPEVLATTVMSVVVFDLLKRCVSKLSE